MGLRETSDASVEPESRDTVEDAATRAQDRRVHLETPACSGRRGLQGLPDSLDAREEEAAMELDALAHPVVPELRVLQERLVPRHTEEVLPASPARQDPQAIRAPKERRDLPAEVACSERMVATESTVRVP